MVTPDGMGADRYHEREEMRRARHQEAARKRRERDNAETPRDRLMRELMDTEAVVDAETREDTKIVMFTVKVGRYDHLTREVIEVLADYEVDCYPIDHHGHNYWAIWA